jgi:hypothetical protein
MFSIPLLFQLGSWMGEQVRWMDSLLYFFVIEPIYAAYSLEGGMRRVL